MAVFTDVAAFVQNIGAYGDKVKKAEPVALKKAALAAVTDIRTEARPYHIGRRKLGAGFDITGSQAVIKTRGPWPLIEKGAKPHAIYPKKRRRGRGRRPAVLVPGLGIFAHVQHPGTHGPIGQPWEKGVAKAKRSAPEAWNEAIRKAL